MVGYPLISVDRAVANLGSEWSAADYAITEHNPKLPPSRHVYDKVSGKIKETWNPTGQRLRPRPYSNLSDLTDVEI